MPASPATRGLNEPSSLAILPPGLASGRLLPSSGALPWSPSSSAVAIPPIDVTTPSHGASFTEIQSSSPPAQDQQEQQNVPQEYRQQPDRQQQSPLMVPAPIVTVNSPDRVTVAASALALASAHLHSPPLHSPQQLANPAHLFQSSLSRSSTQHRNYHQSSSHQSNQNHHGQGQQQQQQSQQHHHRSPSRSNKPQIPGAGSSSSAASPSAPSGPSVVGGHYKVGRKIGEGSFGVIHEGLNLNNNAPIAIKFESRRSDAPQLRDEFRTYKILAGSFGVPTAYYFGQEGHQNVLCIDLLGPSLEDLFELCRRRFSVKTVCMVAKQMVSRIQTLHEHDLIYRDIKPDNFLVGRISRHDPTPICSSHNPEHPHPAAIVYLVDFGMAKRYRDAKSGQHIPYREKKSLSGTARYMSVNTHLGREQSRRDDLESLGHVFMYFLRGSLPWQGLKAPTNKQKYEKIGEKKQAVSPAELGKGHPDEFITYLSYTKGLRFDEEPDYHYLISLFDKVLARAGEVDDGVFDWMPVLDAQRREKERARESLRLERERSSRSGLPRSVVDHAGARMPRATSPMSAAPVVSSSSVDLPAIPSPNPSGLSHIAAAAIAATPSTVAVARSTVQVGDSDPHLAQLTLSPPSTRKMHSAQSPGVATTSMPPAVYARRASVAAAGVNGGAEFEVARSRRTSGGLPRHSVASSRSTTAAPPPGSSAVAPAEFGSGRRRRASEVRRSMAESDAFKRPGASLGPVTSGDSDEETSERPRRPSADGARREVKKSEDVKGSDARQADGAAAARPRRRRRPWFFRLCTCGGGTDEEIAE